MTRIAISTDGSSVIHDAQGGSIVLGSLKVAWRLIDSPLLLACPQSSLIGGLLFDLSLYDQSRYCREGTSECPPRSQFLDERSTGNGQKPPCMYLCITDVFVCSQYIISGYPFILLFYPTISSTFVSVDGGLLGVYPHPIFDFSL